MEIRTFQDGDEEVQAAIYNEAASDLPKFKPATAHEVGRRVAAKEFDPTTRFYAIEAGKPVGYALFNANGRVSYPWCRKGHEQLATPLFHHMMQAMTGRGYREAWAAYRGDWPMVVNYFRQHGFALSREMVNFVIDLVNMPTIPARAAGDITPVERRDVAALYALAPHVVRCRSAEELERHLFENPYFPASSAFVLRGRAGTGPRGVGVLIRNPEYANPRLVDSSMPCFRLGAFGTEGMQTKRINGGFSVLCRDDSQCGAIAADLMGHAASLLNDADDIAVLAGQVPSNATNLLRFYQLTWRRQGSFPVMQRSL